MTSPHRYRSHFLNIVENGRFIWPARPASSIQTTARIMTNGGEASAVRPRSTLPARHHSTIDSCLKTLKTAITAFSTLEHALAEEQQILERLYYKGKNQHRSALFWRHVGEMRRVFKRMIGSTKFRVSNTLEGVRSSFHERASAELSKKA